MVLGATIYKYGVTIATTITGLLMLIMAQAGPDNTCADAGHTQRAAILFFGSRDALVSSLEPTSPGPLGRLVARAVSIQLTVRSATAADRPRDAHRFFSHSLKVYFLPPQNNHRLPFFLPKLLLFRSVIFSFFPKTSLSVAFHISQC